MQTSVGYKVATTENWQPGDKVIVPPPATVDQANARATSGEHERVDWCFWRKSD
jgi:peroxiredoxin (alkyl hydroperoxide reductase subunit C)